MNGFLGVILYSLGMSILVPLFMVFLKRLPADEGLTSDPDSFVMRPKKSAAMVIGILWNLIFGTLIYLWFKESQSASPVLIVLLILALSIGFYIILSSIPGFSEIRVSSEQITLKTVFFVRQLTFADIKSYRYIGRAGTWVVNTKLKKDKRIVFDQLTTNHELFLQKLKEHGIEESKYYDNINTYEYSRKHSRISNILFMTIIPIDLTGMIVLTRVPFYEWEYSKRVATSIAIGFVILDYIFPVFLIFWGITCLRGRYDGWKPVDSTDRNVKINRVLAFIALVTGLISFYFLGSICRAHGLQDFLGVKL